MLKRTMYKTLI